MGYAHIVRRKGGCKDNNAVSKAHRTNQGNIPGGAVMQYVFKDPGALDRAVSYDAVVVFEQSILAVVSVGGRCEPGPRLTQMRESCF